MIYIDIILEKRALNFLSQIQLSSGKNANIYKKWFFEDIESFNFCDKWLGKVKTN